ncbi:MAG: hypothetical protein KGI70_00095 [Patescibacteria group bacterium]|nr:hypothetical protein [Patescibacteria group bacterium]
MKDIVVIYHANCPDGFGGAYAAWKKFGDSADYIAGHHGTVPPEGLEEKEVYLIDYSYTKDTMLALEQKVKKLMVLDHHIGAKDATEAVREHVFDNDQSGAGLAWRYFHPAEPVPRMISYIEDADLFRDALPHTQEMSIFMSIQPREFPHYDRLAHLLQTEEGFREVCQTGESYGEYLGATCDFLAAKAEEVEFEGHHVFAVNVKGTQIMRDEIGIRLYRRQQRPFAIIWNEDSVARGFSMRGDGTVDLAKIAQKYGGNGHIGAASFRLPLDTPLPFTYIKNENPRV